MIVYKDILEKLADRGWTQNKLHRQRLLSGSTISRLKDGRPITTDSIDVVCKLCECQPGDILEYVPDPPDWIDEMAGSK